MKILLIGDIHVGESRDSTSQPGVVRQANTQAEETLAGLIPRFNALDFDLVVHMGDALRDTYVKEIDKRNTTKTLKLLNQIEAPKVHLLGNHELRAFSLDEIKDVYRNAAVDPLFFGMQEFEHFRIVWLDLELHDEVNAFLPQKTLEWLNSLPPSQKPTVVFSHYSLVPIDAVGSFYFEKQPADMHLSNATETIAALRRLSPTLSINGHVHLLSHQQKNEVHYISAPSFSENIAGQQFQENNPGIFSILDMAEDQFVFTTYSGEFCFSKIQSEI